MNGSNSSGTGRQNKLETEVEGRYERETQFGAPRMENGNFWGSK